MKLITGGFLVGLAVGALAFRHGGDMQGPGWSEPHGLVLPRPVATEPRQALGFAAPREASAILARLDALEADMAALTEVNDVWKLRSGEYFALQRQRINCISELEEAGYEGDRLPELLRTKLEDIDSVWPLTGIAATSYDELRQDIVRRHPGSAAELQARAATLMDCVHVVLRAGMRIHPGDYERLAALELRRKAHPDAGILILESLVGERRSRTGDRELADKWKDWIVGNLAPNTLGYRMVTRERMFGAPIRLQGTTLSGQDLDTGSWLGDVVLVDFWGMWCVPCREAMPHLKSLLDKFGSRGLRVVGVFCDHEFAKAEDWLEGQGYSWPQLADRTLTAEKFLHPLAERYAIGGFPTLWVIDRKGVLREEVDRDELEATVLRYLEEKP